MLGAILPWLELWWGSTFYYGEVRDKQGLPNSVVNIGTLGALVLLGYIALRMPLPLESASRRTIVRAALFLGICAMQRLACDFLAGTWNLWQS